jgi:hypothetical protein
MGLLLRGQDIVDNTGTGLRHLGRFAAFHRARLLVNVSCTRDSCCENIIDLRATALAIRDSLNQGLEISIEELDAQIYGYTNRRQELQQPLLRSKIDAASSSHSKSTSPTSSPIHSRSAIRSGTTSENSQQRSEPLGMSGRWPRSVAIWQ